MRVSVGSGVDWNIIAFTLVGGLLSSLAGFLTQWSIASVNARRDLAKRRAELRKDALYAL